MTPSEANRRIAEAQKIIQAEINLEKDKQGDDMTSREAFEAWWDENNADWNRNTLRTMLTKDNDFRVWQAASERAIEIVDLFGGSVEIVAAIRGE